MLNLLQLLCVLSICSFCWTASTENRNINKRDNGRMLFREASTKIIPETVVVTSLVPSSCVQVDATLPPCRYARYLQFPGINSLLYSNMNFLQENSTSPPAASNSTSNATSVQAKIETTPLGWGEYFGLFAPTVTVTSTHTQVKVIEDPKVVVTFAIKGCRPLTIPNGIDRCSAGPDDGPFSIEEILQTSTVPVAPIVPTATLLPTVTAASNTATVNLKNINNNQQQQINNNLLEPSTPEIKGNNINGQLKPTQAL